MRTGLNNIEISKGKSITDNNITPIGKIIRKIGFERVPQLFNVLKGDMSFVGPYPELPSIIEQYRQTMPEFSCRTKAKPGLTGYAQVYGNQLEFILSQPTLKFSRSSTTSESKKVVTLGRVGS